MSQEIRQQVALAVKAIESKKGEDIVILEMDLNAGAFTDYFILCTGTNPRQVQAMSDEVERQLGEAHGRPNSVEGYNQAEWVLLDYVHFVVHIFSERARKFYDLERLWKSARRVTAADLGKKPAARVAAKKLKRTTPVRGKKTAARRTVRAKTAKRTASRPKTKGKKTRVKKTTVKKTKGKKRGR